MQQGDVLIFQTGNGGEISVVNGLTQMTGGFESAVYLSLFGGNQDDDGSQGNKKNWWGNFVEEDPIFHYRSKTQYLLNKIVPVSGNLIKLEKAVLEDLNWMIETNSVSSLEVNISLIAIRRVAIDITILADADRIDIQFLANWQAQAA